jgi:hypothetical protein
VQKWHYVVQKWHYRGAEIVQKWHHVVQNRHYPVVEVVQKWGKTLIWCTRRKFPALRGPDEFWVQVSLMLFFLFFAKRMVKMPIDFGAVL